MSLTYAEIKTAMDLVIKNAPGVKVRGAVHNTNLTNVAQLARDRMANITINVSGLADEYMMYYNSSTSTWKFRKVRHAGSFVDGDLNAGVLELTHGLGTQTPKVTIYDDSGDLVNPFGITNKVDTNNVNITLGSISSTWYYDITF